MKRAVFAILATVVGLLALLQYDVPAPPALALPPAVTAAPTGGTTPPAATSAAPTAGGPSPEPAPEQPRTLVGQTVDTEEGPVQVQVTLTGTAITDVSVLQYPSGAGRHQEINSFALPQLVQQAMALQSADIDMVSGATYTSEGFIQSMQSALDQA